MDRKLTNQELQRIGISAYKTIQKRPIVLLLEDIRSLHNIGSVFRTADAFAIEAIYLCGFTACPPRKEIQKTALGATEAVKWKYFASAAEAILELKNEAYEVMALEQTENAISLIDFRPVSSKKYAFVLGNEVNGVSSESILQSVGCIEIPQFGTKHSFNISISAGILLWDLYTKVPAHGVKKGV